MPLTTSTEYGWLIEFKSSGLPVYYGKTNEGLGMTEDHAMAIRFCRKQDAEMMIDDIGWTEAFPVEHAWD